MVTKKLPKNSTLSYKELGSTFSLSRFHLNAHISDKKADELWIRYLQNYQLSDDRHMFVAYIDDIDVGVVLVNVENYEATLFYVSVLKNFQGCGVGGALIHEILKYFDGFEIYTETQAKNIAALNFYIKNGFYNIDKTFTVLHRWDK